MSNVADIGLIDELRSLFLKAADHCEQAGKHLLNDDPQWACNLVSLTHYQLGQAADCRDNLLRVFEGQGITPKTPDS
jgi:hypothetical protein